MEGMVCAVLCSTVSVRQHPPQRNDMGMFLLLVSLTRFNFNIFSRTGKGGVSFTSNCFEVQVITLKHD